VKRPLHQETVDALLLLVLLGWAVFVLVGAEVFPAEWAGALAPSAVAPGPGTPLGTDTLGRALGPRLIEGMRTTMGVGIGATLIALLLGSLYGALAGLAGPKTDEVLMRGVDVGLALPFLFLIILLVTLFGRSMTILFCALGLMSWMPLARVVRAGVRDLRDGSFLEAARMMGASRFYILRAHLLPQLGTPLVVWSTLTLPVVMMEEAFLSFLGLGVPPPQASWGTLVAEGVARMETAPWILMLAGGSLALFLVLLHSAGDRMARRMGVHRLPETPRGGEGES
jgi:oligopeptide transport system permease protein